MANGLNRFFLQDTKAFVMTNYMTNAGVFTVRDQANAIDLHRLEGGQLGVVRIEPTNAASDDDPIPAYWLPQGGSCDIPVVASERKFVFTPDFSGCSLLIDQINDMTYRVYHVTGGGGYFQTEYNGKRPRQSELAAALTHEGYGTPGSPRALLFMKFEEGRWWIYYQGQTGAGYGLIGNRVERVQGSSAVDSIRTAGRMPVARVTKGEIPLFTSDRLCDGQLVIPRAPSPALSVRRPRSPSLMTNLWIY